MHSSIRDKSEETEINEKNLFVFPQKNQFPCEKPLHCRL